LIDAVKFRVIWPRHSVCVPCPCGLKKMLLKLVDDFPSDTFPIQSQNYRFNDWLHIPSNWFSSVFVNGIEISRVLIIDFNCLLLCWTLLTQVVLCYSDATTQNSFQLCVKLCDLCGYVTLPNLSKISLMQFHLSKLSFAVGRVLFSIKPSHPPRTYELVCSNSLNIPFHILSILSKETPQMVRKPVIIYSLYRSVIERISISLGNLFSWIDFK
jgi:hypothetical protein